jgi:hypothetical protein
MDRDVDVPSTSEGVVQDRSFRVRDSVCGPRGQRCQVPEAWVPQDVGRESLVAADDQRSRSRLPVEDADKVVLHGLDDPRVAVADTGDGDAGPEVDQLVAVGIDEDPVPPLDDVGRQPPWAPRR